ncbi:MAG: ATP-binding protein [Chloroflexota bacterium]
MTQSIISPTSRPAAGTLADLAHLLESVDQWEARIGAALSVLRDLVPHDVCGLLVNRPGHEPIRIVSPVGLDQPETLARLERMLSSLADRSKDELDAAPHLLSNDSPEHGAHLAVPLVSLAELSGLLYVRSDAPDVYQERHLRRLAVAAAQLASYVSLVTIHQSEQLLRAQLQDVLQQRDEFVAMVSHDIKNPLAAIRGSAQLLRRRAEYNERLVDSIIGQTEQIERLCTDLLDVAHVTSEHFELRREPVDLARLVDECVTVSRRNAGLQRIILHLPTESIIGAWDAGRIRQVCQNLLSNAIKYSTHGGEIVVRIEHLGEEARVSVRDQGIGLPPDQVMRVFDRFYREAAGERVAQGLGLGLNIAQALIGLHGGRIWAESGGPGHGSTFFFTLPL